jgi:hypothetical protein
MDLKAMGNLRTLIAAAIVLCAGGKVAMAQAYQQTNLVSDIQGLAQNPLKFGNDHSAGPSNWLFFTAGVGEKAHGLFGFFTPADNRFPEGK